MGRKTIGNKIDSAVSGARKFVEPRLKKLRDAASSYFGNRAGRIPPGVPPAVPPASSGASSLYDMGGQRVYSGYGNPQAPQPPAPAKTKSGIGLGGLVGLYGLSPSIADRDSIFKTSEDYYGPSTGESSALDFAGRFGAGVFGNFNKALPIRSIAEKLQGSFGSDDEVVAPQTRRRFNRAPATRPTNIRYAIVNPSTFEAGRGGDDVPGTVGMGDSRGFPLPGKGYINKTGYRIPGPVRPDGTQGPSVDANFLREEPVTIFDGQGAGKRSIRDAAQGPQQSLSAQLDPYGIDWERVITDTRPGKNLFGSVGGMRDTRGALGRMYRNYDNAVESDYNERKLANDEYGNQIRAQDSATKIEEAFTNRLKLGIEQSKLGIEQTKAAQDTFNDLNSEDARTRQFATRRVLNRAASGKPLGVEDDALAGAALSLGLEQASRGDFFETLWQDLGFGASRDVPMSLNELVDILEEEDGVIYAGDRKIAEIEDFTDPAMTNFFKNTFPRLQRERKSIRASRG